MKDYKLLVSGLGGIVYIATTLKQKGVMSADRIKVEDSDFMIAIEQFVRHRLKKGADTLEIKTESGKVIMQIKINNLILKP